MLTYWPRIAAHPHQNFTIVLNPASGPGSSPSPNDDYTAQIQKLNSYPNVRTIGYVPTAYATRNITSVLLDVSTYSGWLQLGSTNTNSTGLAVQGIFFDEVPRQYSPEASEYLKTINKAVKNASGLLPDRMVSEEYDSNRFRGDFAHLSYPGSSRLIRGLGHPQSRLNTRFPF
jgi:hypothetical protein